MTTSWPAAVEFCASTYWYICYFALSNVRVTFVLHILNINSRFRLGCTASPEQKSILDEFAESLRCAIAGLKLVC
jgi:hypothetical protein